MSQTFHLQLATNTLLCDAQQLNVSPEQLQAIEVKVQATIINSSEPYLWLTYTITLPAIAYDTLAAQLNWADWQLDHVNFTDYLWEHTCLECFISTDNTASYIEINANPNGRYAIYQFNDYRHPSRLPPPPLYLTDTQQLASIDWAMDSKQPFNVNKQPHHKSQHYERRFGVALQQLNISLPSLKDDWSLQLHPCVILQFSTEFDTSTLYFAPTHASPPDFHQRRYWTTFNPTATS